MRTATPQVTFLPPLGGGKYHAVTPIVATARCRGTVLLDTAAGPIMLNPGDGTRVPPIICRRCYAAATPQGATP